MLALVAMERPKDFSADAIRAKREEILETLVVPRVSEIKRESFRAQYSGYRAVPGVMRRSQTETYFKIRLRLAAPQWRGVPIILESGKRLKKQQKEIVITFRHRKPCLCPRGSAHYRNQVIIRLEPQEEIKVRFWSKKPGLAFTMEERDFSFLLRESGAHSQYTEEYEKLLLDCIAGNQTLFVSSREVAAMWRFIDPIIRVWKRNEVPLRHYQPDTDEPVVALEYPEEIHAAIAPLKKEIGFVGLGKMGGNLARQLLEKGWAVSGMDANPLETKKLESEGLGGAYFFRELARVLPRPRLIWLLVLADRVDETLFGTDGILRALHRGDIVIDGGNSFYEHSAARYKKLKKLGIRFVDVGVSGGPQGAREGVSLMIGGDAALFKKLEPLFRDIAAERGYQFFAGVGAGHFVKMIHNGIEYGMMQSLAEGFAVLKKSRYKFNLTRVANAYNHGSVIESRLVAWLENAFLAHGDTLRGVSGAAGHTGEGEWTVTTAKNLRVPTPVIKSAFEFRLASARNPSFTGKILSALRNQFGGHTVRQKNSYAKKRSRGKN